jgi:general secretion pathway protein I
LFRSRQPDPDIAGFTLIEVLVALAVVAVSLSSIGMLIATTVRGTRSIDSHLALLETSRAIEAALPDRDQLAVGSFSGQRAQQRWRVDILPFAGMTHEAPQASNWEPFLVVLQVRSPGGPVLQIPTIRLHQRAAR